MAFNIPFRQLKCVRETFSHSLGPKDAVVRELEDGAEQVCGKSERGKEGMVGTLGLIGERVED